MFCYFWHFFCFWQYLACLEEFISVLLLYFSGFFRYIPWYDINEQQQPSWFSRACIFIDWLWRVSTRLPFSEWEIWASAQQNTNLFWVGKPPTDASTMVSSDTMVNYLSLQWFMSAGQKGWNHSIEKNKPGKDALEK